MYSETRGCYGNSWKKGENPEEKILDETIGQDRAPEVVEREVVKLVLGNYRIVDLVHNTQEGMDLLRSNADPNDVKTGKKIQRNLNDWLELRDGIEQDVLNEIERRPCSGELRVAIRFATVLEEKCRLG